jgi:hypothetical protein
MCSKKGHAMYYVNADYETKATPLKQQQYAPHQPSSLYPS